MSCSSALALLLTVITSAPPAALARPDSISAPAVRVVIDSARHEVRIIAGPFHIDADTSHGEAMHALMHAEQPLLRFVWPVDGWLHGYTVDLRTADDAPLAREMIHHAGLANFARRQLVYPMLERTLAVGKETQPLTLPGGVGVPVRAGDTLGLYTGLHNPAGTAVNGAYLRITLQWMPRSRHHPIEVLPFFADVNNIIGGTTAFDLPPGRSIRHAEFTLPASGRLLGVGGHLHDYGVALRLEDAETGKTLVRLPADRASDGHVRGVGRFLFGFHENALRLEAHHRYRVVAEYDNPTGDTLRLGGMGSIAGPFVPDDLRAWPPLDLANVDVRKDIESLDMAGMDMPGMDMP